MKLLVVALCLGLSLAAPQKSIQNGTWEEPAFCKTLDCPVFTLLDANEAEDWELRSYDSGMWVSTEVNAIVDNVNEQLEIAFNRLFDYISGENDQGVVIDMTAPVITKVVPGEGPNCNSYFTRSFYLPYALQSSPPNPTNPQVYLEQLPATTLYAEMFDGYAEVTDYISKIIELSESIGQENHETAFYYMVGYDSPFNPFNRHNEAWLIAK